MTKRIKANDERVTVRYTDGSEHNGTLKYRTADGQWFGVQLDGEKRVDEYPVEFIEIW